MLETPFGPPSPGRGGAGSRRLIQALALLTTAVSGWLTSCAMEAVSSPCGQACHMSELGLSLMQLLLCTIEILDIGLEISCGFAELFLPTAFVRR